MVLVLWLEWGWGSGEGWRRWGKHPTDTPDLSRIGKEGMLRRSSLRQADFCLRQLKLVQQCVQEADCSGMQVSPSSQEVSVGKPWPETLAPGMNFPDSCKDVSCSLPKHVAQPGCHLRPPGGLNREHFQGEWGPQDTAILLGPRMSTILSSVQKLHHHHLQQGREDM